MKCIKELFNQYNNFTREQRDMYRISIQFFDVAADNSRDLIDLLDSKDRDDSDSYLPHYRNNPIQSNNSSDGILEYSHMLNYECPSIDEAVLIYTTGIQNMMRKNYYRVHNSS